MKSAIQSVCLLSLAFAGVAGAQTPTIAGVGDTVSGGTRLAPGILASVFGTNLGTSVTIPVLVGGKAAAVISASAGQLNIQVPVDAPVGPTTITAGGSAPFNITLSQYAPVLFSADGSGKGSILARHLNQSPVNAASPANPGETILIFAIGLGATTPPVATGTIATTLNSTATATVTVGTQAATVLFSGLASAVGLYQVNITLAAAQSGGSQPIVLSIGGVSSQAGVTLPVAGAASAAPTISAVVDGVSGGTRLAPGTLANVFGTGLGTDKTIVVTAGGKKAAVLAAVDNQLSIQIPVDASVGPTTITVGTSAPFSITLSQYAPALPTVDSSGKGNISAIHTDSTQVTAANPAKPGEAITIFAIGLGVTNPQVPTGTATPLSPPAKTAPAQATVTVAGQPASVSFSGLQPGAIGVYQVNLTVPSGIPGGSQTISLSIGGVSSQAGTTLAVAGPPGPLIRSGPDGVLSAGTYFPQGAPGSGIAQGSYFVVKGSGLGPADIVLAAPPFTTSVGGANGTSVTITPAGGSPIPAFMYYALDVQVAGILPSNTPLGAATVTVTYNGVTSPPAKMTVVKSAFGMYTLNQGGSGPALIQNVSSDGKSAPLNGLTTAAAPGQFMVLYGTGLGPVSTSDSDAPGQVIPAGISVQVLVGSKVITPLYAGRQGQYPGFDQIVFQLPSDNSVPDGCFVPLAVVVNGVSSNYGTFAKATGSSTCPAPLGLTASMLTRLDQGGKLTGGVITLSKFTAEISAAGLTVDTSSEKAFASFTAVDANGLFGLAQTPGATSALNPAGTCVVVTTDASASPTSTIPAALKQLNAGSPLTLGGPNGKTASLPFDAGNGYSATLATSTPLSTATFIEAGPWSMRGPGGADVGSFTANVTVPAPLACTNCAAITTIDRTQPLTINWTGGGGSQDSVQIGGTSAAPSTADPTQNVAVAFSCAARASDGTLTVPVSILSQMPPSSNDPSAASIGTLTVVNVLGAGNTFTAPLAAGGSLDFGLFNYSSLFFKIVGYN